MGSALQAWELLFHSAEEFGGKARSQGMPSVAKTVLEHMQENGVVRNLWRPLAQPQAANCSA